MSVNTLLLRLAAPLQSWGDYSRFSRRDTRREPTKSGVVGLVAAALGRRREDRIEDISSLAFGVRIDRSGVFLRDFHTARNDTQAFVSQRYYLADALFLVGLSGELSFLREIDQAIQSPVFPLFLGRRSCPPEGRISLGIRKMGLVQALESEPWLADKEMCSQKLEIVVDAESGIVTQDLPISFSQKNRTYGTRTSMRREISLKHDAMALFKEEDVSCICPESN